MKDYSAEKFTCSFCKKQMRGYVPSLGDGTGFLIPRHKDRDGNRCKGSHTMFSVGDSKKSDHHHRGREQ